MKELICINILRNSKDIEFTELFVPFILKSSKKTVKLRIKLKYVLLQRNKIPFFIS